MSLQVSRGMFAAGWSLVWFAVMHAEGHWSKGSNYKEEHVMTQ